ncbi:hypothetical protein [Streptomyces sp. NRRL S-87]|uniref:hypothetical protein n=1 Tax=Streptomyces sp. NRRL S-87 TaxID=1463920 RepID=UPI0004C1A887|nr:hypothetical protein [Streptomyces sp. NRRL S-87]
MTSPEFYERDRPEHPRLPEDRPRGAGPEDRSHRGTRALLVIILAACLIVLLVFLLFSVV